MGHLVAYFGNETDRVECALFSARLALFTPAPSRPFSWGLGFVQNGDVLLQKRPRGGSAEVDFFGLAKDLKADAFIGRVKFEDEQPQANENSDPYRFRSWLWSAVGLRSEAEGDHSLLLATVPAFLRRNLRGTSGSELLFHLFLTRLHAAGMLEPQSPHPPTVARALAESQEALAASVRAQERAPTWAAVATNGRCLVAGSAGHPMQFLQIRGVTDCTACRRKRGEGESHRRISHETLNAVIVEADAAVAARPGWQALPEGDILMAGPDRVGTVISAAS